MRICPDILVLGCIYLGTGWVGKDAGSAPRMWWGSSQVNWGMQRMTYFIQQLLVPTQWEDHCLTWIVQMPCSPIKFPHFTAECLRLVCENRSAANCWKLEDAPVNNHGMSACMFYPPEHTKLFCVCVLHGWGGLFSLSRSWKMKAILNFLPPKCSARVFFKVEAFAVAQHGHNITCVRSYLKNCWNNFSTHMV